jgi:hypothetical protein
MLIDPGGDVSRKIDPFFGFFIRTLGSSGSFALSSPSLGSFFNRRGQVMIEPLSNECAQVFGIILNDLFPNFSAITNRVGFVFKYPSVDLFIKPMFDFPEFFKGLSNNKF